jgi:REP element-mobilizing transposase RayT
MSRPLRLEYSHAIYHVTARGNARAAIFLDDEDRINYLNVLADCITRFGWICHAYCLMDNHYHLMLETPDANLSAGMRHLNGVYTQQLNRRHQRVGHVFQGRFKAILVERESYLLELCRYVVLNPVRANMVSDVSQYKWSSYQAMVGTMPVPPWLDTDWLLGQFGDSRAVARRKYALFVAQGLQQNSPWLNLKGQVLLGGESFIENSRSRMQKQGGSEELPTAQRNIHRPDLASLLPESIRLNKIKRDEVIRTAYLEYHYSMAAIARQAGLHYSTVGKIIRGER